MHLQKFKKHLPLALFFVFVALVAGYAYVFEELPKLEARAQKSAQMAALLTPLSEPWHFDKPSQSVDCQEEDFLPDQDCTPGAIFEDATLEVICVSGYSKTVRDVSVSTKKKIFASYGIDYPVPFGSYEIDHLIPLALGGNNTTANLWPKVADPFLGFFEKNVTGNYLREEVCAGNVDLYAAQAQIADNWVAVYENIPPERIVTLKKKYPNWADRSK